MIQGEDWVFIHNPKCAGTSIKHILSKYGERSRQHSHIGYPELSAAEKTKFCFTFVRNPFDRLVSIYEFTKKKTKAMGTSHYGWVTGLKDINRPFKEWLVDSEFWEDNFGVDELLPVQKRSQRYFAEGVDYVGKVENFAEDMAEVCSRINVPFKYDKRNETPHGHYRDYYDEESRAFVEKWFAWDLETFGYEF